MYVTSESTCVEVFVHKLSIDEGIRRINAAIMLSVDYACLNLIVGELEMLQYLFSTEHLEVVLVR